MSLINWFFICGTLLYTPWTVLCSKPNEMMSCFFSVMYREAVINCEREEGGGLAAGV